MKFRKFENYWQLLCKGTLLLILIQLKGKDILLGKIIHSMAYFLTNVKKWGSYYPENVPLGQTFLESK